MAGRSTYTNAGRTRRRGVESSADWSIADDWRLRAAWTVLDARYRDPFATCNATPCTVPTTAVPAGNRIPGVAAVNAYAELVYAPDQGWRAGLEARHGGRIEVDDANTDAASRYTVFNVRGGYGWQGPHWRVEAFARVDNVSDRVGDRQRRQRPLLRAGAGAGAARRRVGDGHARLTPRHRVAETRHTALPTSSATSSAPVRSSATPTGRPCASPAADRKPVSTSIGAPDGRPSANGTKTTL